MLSEVDQRLIAKLDEHGLENLSQAVGQNTDTWAEAQVDE